MNRNGSGVYDGTAYKGMMGAPKPGEVWMHRNGHTEKEVLVIQNHGTESTILTLTDESKSKLDIQIISKSIKYARPHMLQYAFNQSFGEFVKKLSDADFDNVLDAIEDALDLNIYRADDKDAKEAVEAAEQKVKAMEAQLEQMKCEVKAMEAQLEDARKKQTSVDSHYKAMYQKLVLDLLDRGLISVGVNDNE